MVVMIVVLMVLQQDSDNGGVDNGVIGSVNGVGMNGVDD